jgi:hypothetical protein
MSIETARRLRYSFHGIELEVRASDAAALDAMDLRLRDFGQDVARDHDGTAGQVVTFEFLRPGESAGGNGAHALVEVEESSGRPVYDTPHGSLRYVPEADVLHGALGGVSLHCEPANGAVRLSSGEFSGSRLYFATHPLATVGLMQVLQRRGLYSVHAACVASAAGRGVLIAGGSGAGKSTLSVALTRAGMRFLSDDLVFVRRLGPGGKLRILGFADTLGLTPHAALCFPELRDRLDGPPDEGFPKRLRRIEDLYPAHSERACDPVAIVFPQITDDAGSELHRLDGGEALLRLVPDVLLTNAEATQRHLDVFGALLRQVQCYSLTSGRDLERAAALVGGLVAG